ncbi:MAG: hypothetical protein AAGC79_15625, partial [Pseudomonadota bacterium]
PESSHMRELLSIPKKLNLIKQFTPEQRQMVRTAITHAVATAADPSKADEAGLAAKTKLMTALKGGDMGDFKKAMAEVSPELKTFYENQGKFNKPGPAKSLEDSAKIDPKIDDNYKYDGQQFEDALNNKDYNDIHVNTTAYLLGKGGGGENVAFLDQLLSAIKMPLETEEQAAAFKEHLGVLRKTIGKVGQGDHLKVNLANNTETYIRDQLDKAQDIKDLEGLKEFQKTLSENPKNDKGRSVQVGFLAAKNEALIFVSSKMGQVLLERKDQS